MFAGMQQSNGLLLRSPGFAVTLLRSSLRALKGGSTLVPAGLR
jgi:hypothetical protein